MGAITQPLRDEHKELFPHVEEMRAAADAVGEVSDADLRERVDAVYEFLAHHLIPHAHAEEAALYPVVEHVFGATGATATMSRDHVAVGALTEELAALRTRLDVSPTADDMKALRRVLYGIYTLVGVHFAKEEEVYLPLLDARLTEDEARHMFASMHGAAHSVA